MKSSAIEYATRLSSHEAIHLATPRYCSTPYRSSQLHLHVYWVYMLTNGITGEKSIDELLKSEQGYQMKRKRLQIGTGIEENIKWSRKLRRKTIKRVCTKVKNGVIMVLPPPLKKREKREKSWSNQLREGNRVKGCWQIVLYIPQPCGLGNRCKYALWIEVN